MGDRWQIYKKYLILLRVIFFNYNFSYRFKNLIISNILSIFLKDELNFY